MVRVVWPDETLDQLDQIVAYIELFDPNAAARMAARLVDLGESLAQYPHRGRSAGNGTRELVTVPPYILRYTVQDDCVIVAGVRHGARLADPD